MSITAHLSRSQGYRGLDYLGHQPMQYGIYCLYYSSRFVDGYWWEVHSLWKRTIRVLNQTLKCTRNLVNRSSSAWINCFTIHFSNKLPDQINPGFDDRVTTLSNLYPVTFHGWLPRRFEIGHAAQLTVSWGCTGPSHHVSLSRKF